MIGRPSAGGSNLRSIAVALKGGLGEPGDQAADASTNSAGPAGDTRRSDVRFAFLGVPKWSGLLLSIFLFLLI